jgi:hypothetical protein
VAGEALFFPPLTCELSAPDFFLAFLVGDELVE